MKSFCCLKKSFLIATLLINCFLCIAEENELLISGRQNNFSADEENSFSPAEFISSGEETDISSPDDFSDEEINSPSSPADFSDEEINSPSSPAAFTSGEVTNASSSEETDIPVTIILPDVTTIISRSVEKKTVLTAERIQEKHPVDLPSLLQSEGIELLSYGPYGMEQKPQIRGFTDETVRVVIDGICVNNAQYGTFDFSSLNPADIEKIEVIRGGFTEGVNDEGAVGGVIYITTKKIAQEISFNLDSLMKTYFTLSSPVDSVSLSTGISAPFSDTAFFKTNIKAAVSSNAYTYRMFGKEYIRENAEVKDFHSDVKFQQFFGQGNSITLSDIFYAGDKNIPGNIRNKVYGKQNDLSNTLSLQLLTPQFFFMKNVNNTAAWLWSERNYNDAVSDSRHIVSTIKFSSSAEMFTGEHLEQNAGLTFDYTDLDSTDDGKVIQIAATLKENTKILFAEDLIVTVPLAVKISGENAEFIPKAGIKKKTSFADFSLNAYRMVQFPNLDDMYWNDSAGNHGNPDLKPESGWGGEFVLESSAGGFPFSINVFTDYYENKIQWAQTETGWSPMNVASAFYAGVDFELQKSFLNEKLMLKISGEYLYTCLLNKNNEYWYGKKIMLTPDFTACVSLSWKRNNLLAILDVNYVGIRYTSNDNNFTLSPYVLVDVLVNFTDSVELGRDSRTMKFTPYMKIENLLNWKYETAENYPMPGISFSLGIRHQS